MIKRRDLLVGGGCWLSGAALGLVTAQGAAHAHEYEVGTLKVEHPWLRAPNDGENKAHFFAFIHNNGDTPDKLIGARSASFDKVEIRVDPHHETVSDGIVIPPKTKVTLRPHGPQLDLLDIKKHLEVGWGLELVLVFEKAGEVTIDASIEAPDAQHAHDAEAMERWEKAHATGAAAPSPHEGHHEHHKMQHPAPAQTDAPEQSK